MRTFRGAKKLSSITNTKLAAGCFTREQIIRFDFYNLSENCVTKQQKKTIRDFSLLQVQGNERKKNKNLECDNVLLNKMQFGAI